MMTPLEIDMLALQTSDFTLFISYENAVKFIICVSFFLGGGWPINNKYILTHKFSLYQHNAN